MSKTTTILITGSLGYIGSVLCPYLRRTGYTCLGLDVGFFKECIICEPEDGNVVLTDMRQFDPGMLKGVAAVVHLAGISNDPFGNLSAQQVYEPTRAFTLKLARSCKERGVKFIFASSCSVYGRGSGDLCMEDSEPNPQTPYSENKWQIEQDLAAISCDSFTPIIFRFATLFGPSPRMRFDIVVNMLAGMAFCRREVVLNSDGTAWRPYVHMLDVCKAIRNALDFEPTGGSPVILNVGDTSQNFQIIDIAEMVRSAVPQCALRRLMGGRLTEEEELIRDRKVQDGVDTRTYKVSFERIKSVFPDFQCAHTVANGLEELIEFFNNVGLTEGVFTDPRFYRLQMIESLYAKKKISQELSWL